MTSPCMLVHIIQIPVIQCLFVPCMHAVLHAWFFSTDMHAHYCLAIVCTNLSFNFFVDMSTVIAILAHQAGPALSAASKTRLRPRSSRAGTVTRQDPSIPVVSGFLRIPTNVSSHCLPLLLDTWPLRYQVPPDQLALVPEVSGHVFEAAVGDPVPIQAGPEVRGVSSALRRDQR